MNDYTKISEYLRGGKKNEIQTKTQALLDAGTVAQEILEEGLMPAMGNVVAAVKEAGIYNKVGIMIGGAPVTDGFKEAIGAHLYSGNAASAADAAIEFIGK